MGHSILQWDTMFETTNNPRYMVSVQKSSRTKKSRPSLELCEEIEDPVLRGKGDGDGRQGCRRMTYSP